MNRRTFLESQIELYTSLLEHQAEMLAILENINRNNQTSNALKIDEVKKQIEADQLTLISYQKQLEALNQGQ